MKKIYTVGALMALSAVQAMAAGTGMPWEEPALRVLASLTGPMAYIFCVGGLLMMAAGAYWQQHSDFGVWGRMAMFGVMFGGLICFAAPIMQEFFGVSGAVV